MDLGEAVQLYYFFAAISLSRARRQYKSLTHLANLPKTVRLDPHVTHGDVILSRTVYSLRVMQVLSDRTVLLLVVLITFSPYLHSCVR